MVPACQLVMEASYYVPSLFIASGARSGVDNAYRESAAKQQWPGDCTIQAGASGIDPH